MSSPPEDFTLGVEEEYQIVDARTRVLRPRAGRVVPAAQEEVGDEATNELFLSQIEIGTPPRRSLADVRAEIVRLRRAVIEAAGRSGCRIAAAGTHPFSHWDDQAITPKPRYFGIADDFQQLAREQIVCGCHVHVGIGDREGALGVMNRVRPWLPALLALSANSPFWLGLDSGFSSYRTELFGRFPTAGLPLPFASRAEFDALVADLVAVEGIEDASKLYWDARPSSHFETLEFRVADVCMTIDEAVMIAGLCRALARACLADHHRGEPMVSVRPELLRIAKFRASRHGLEGDLIAPLEKKAVPAAKHIATLLAFARPELEEEGDWDEVSALVKETLKRGNGAHRQREAYAQASHFEDVVDRVVEETARGTS